MVSRSEKVVNTFEELLGCGELYHYHSKLMMKEARTGGQHVWHQDYGYWYENGCLYPDMGSVFIALDPCTTENGCLQVSAMLYIRSLLSDLIICTSLSLVWCNLSTMRCWLGPTRWGGLTTS